MLVKLTIHPHKKVKSIDIIYLHKSYLKVNGKNLIFMVKYQTNLFFVSKFL